MDTQTTQPAMNELDNERYMAEYLAKRRGEDLLAACRRAVECLERFADQARRGLEQAGDLDPARLLALPGDVLSASTWGAANASSELSSATRIAVEYMNALGALEALKGGAR